MKVKKYNFVQPELAWSDLEKDLTLGPIVRKWGKCPLKPSIDYFGELCEIILAQQISGKAAKSMAEKLRNKLNGLLTSVTVTKLNMEHLREMGISRRKAFTILELANSINNGKIPIENFINIDDDEIFEALTEIKGIGTWTVMMFLIFALNRPRIIPANDYGIRKAIQKLYGLYELPTVIEVIKYFQAWAPHETAASWYLWRSLDNNGKV